jgi:hypothetical protein
MPPLWVTSFQRTEGEPTYVGSEDCVGQRYATGTAFVDPGHGHVHTAYNSGKTKTVFLATFLEVPEGTGPISILADEPAGCKIPTS